MYSVLGEFFRCWQYFKVLIHKGKGRLIMLKGGEPFYSIVRSDRTFRQRTITTHVTKNRESLRIKAIFFMKMINE